MGVRGCRSEGLQGCGCRGVGCGLLLGGLGWVSKIQHSTLGTIGCPSPLCSLSAEIMGHLAGRVSWLWGLADTHKAFDPRGGPGMKQTPGSPSLRPSHLPLGICPEGPWQAVRATLQEPRALISPWISQPGAQALTPHCLANSLFCVFLRKTESGHSRSPMEVALSMCLCCAHRQAVAPVCVCTCMLHVHMCMHEPGSEGDFRNQASLDVAS